MNSRRAPHLILWLIVFLLLELPALSCGPDFPEAVFIKSRDPDAPYTRFAAGHLGIPQPGFRTRHLTLAYLYLSGHPLTPAEQQDARAADDSFTQSEFDPARLDSINHAGFIAWTAARKHFGLVDGFMPDNFLGTDQAWQMNAYFERCQDDAFATAARTLHDRISNYGNRTPDTIEWVRGQDAVFHQCATVSPYTPPGQAPPRLPDPPAALPSSAPLWLRQDRAYQQAAAAFYDNQFDTSITGFRIIASDTASPWHTLARYLVARVLTEKATHEEGYDPNFTIDPDPHKFQQQTLALQARYLAELRAAAQEIAALQSDPAMAPFQHALFALSDRVAARLNPELQQRGLAQRLLAAPDPNLRQDLIDFSYLLAPGQTGVTAIETRPKPTPPPPSTAAEREADDLIAWIRAMHTSDGATALARWHETRSAPWLLAALTFAQPGDADTPSLLAAARAVPASNPGWTAITYHRLRLEITVPATRPALLAMIHQVGDSDGPSTANLFAALDRRSAPTFNLWLAQAGRIPAAQSTMDGETDLATSRPAEPQPCGPPVSETHLKLFPDDAAAILNTRLPIRRLIAAAEDPALPPNLRFQIAQAAWTRAALLDRQADAQRLAPILIHCNALWRPVLEAYNNASTPTDREAARLFALMRFASTEPNVRAGEQREDGFAHYSYYRDNWWCQTVPDRATGLPTALWPQDDQRKASVIPDPAFLTADDRAEADAEYTALARIPSATAYLAPAAIAWQSAHPADPRAPELIGQTFRLARNACSQTLWLPDEEIAKRHLVNYEHRLFMILHTHYPNSPWARRYTVWDK